MAAGLHLVKLCVGVETPAELARLQKKKRDGLYHDTRAFPKRAAEILDGGSLYWVFRGLIRARQRIKAFEPVRDDDGMKKCRIFFAPELYLTHAQPRRAFQGWRYLEADAAPKDLTPHDKDFADMPDDMRQELMELGMFSRYT